MYVIFVRIEAICPLQFIGTWHQVKARYEGCAYNCFISQRKWT